MNKGKLKKILFLTLCTCLILGTHMALAKPRPGLSVKVPPRLGADQGQLIQKSSPTIKSPRSTAKSPKSTAKSSRSAKPVSPRNQKEVDIKLSVTSPGGTTTTATSDDLIHQTRKSTLRKKPKITHDLKDGYLADPRHLRDNFESSR
ncbi:MAG: hypothetical protein ABIQ95_12235 [Bdellovibrionia bacterium]